MAKKRKKKNKVVSQPQVKHQEASPDSSKKSNELKLLVGTLAVILSIGAIAINWVSNLDLSSKDSLSVQSSSTHVSTVMEPLASETTDIKNNEITNIRPYSSDYPLTEAEFNQIVRYVEKSLPEAKALKNTDDLIKALSIIERLPYEKLKLWFDRLAEEIRNTPYNEKNYDQLHEMHKLAAVSQFLKTKVMTYDQNRVTTGQLISEILATGFGACASMPTMYAIVCQHMGLDVKIATVGDHIYARYQTKDTWVNIEMTVKGKTGVGVPDQAYKYDFMNSNTLFRKAIENGWDMTSLDNKQIMGNHVFQ